MTPRAVFRRVATAEAVTWALLLLGMVLKYGTRTTELGVRVFGLVHGVVFVGYCLTAVFVAVNQRWGARRTLLALAAAVPPFATVWFDRWAQRRGLLADGWRLVPGGDRPSSTPSGSRPGRWPGRPWPWRSGPLRWCRSPVSRSWSAHRCRPAADFWPGPRLG